jgi:hypothetical protein
MEPRRAAVFVGAPEPDLGGAGVAQQKIRERIAPLSIECERATRGGRVDRVELQPEEVASELLVMATGIQQDVVVQLVLRFSRETNDVGSPIVLNRPPNETWGNPMSRGSCVTPWSPDVAGKFTP